MTFFDYFYLDKEKDIVVKLFKDKQDMHFVIETPNHHTGNLIENLAKITALPVSENERGLKIIKGDVPCYVDGDNNTLYIFRLGNTKVANIYPDGKIELKASIPSISKTLMSQTKDYKLDEKKTIIKSYIRQPVKFTTDLHTHMNANLPGDVLIALAIVHQIKYPLYYIRKLGLKLTDSQSKALKSQRNRVEKQFASSLLTGKYLQRRIDDNTFINFADLILKNLQNADENIVKIRSSLSILKDGQAVFTNLEKTYLYRYVFTKATEHETKIPLDSYRKISDKDIVGYITQMLNDRENPDYCDNTIFMDKLLWIGRMYQKQGVKYVEISDTTLVKKYESVQMLKQCHEILPKVEKETGVAIRFLAAIRRIPLTIVKDTVIDNDYLKNNIAVLKFVSQDPYVVGSDFVGEEINDITTMKPVIQQLVQIANNVEGFVIRIHAGENDSLKDNVSNSINLVKQSLLPGQSMPQVRLGHGLYTAKLTSKKGKELLDNLKSNNVILEFQISSNVRLNNLNNISEHPLKQYLKAGIRCVQGSDGAAIYGTNSIDEQLTLEKLLELSYDDMMKMKKVEEEVIASSRKAFEKKLNRFNQLIEAHPDIDGYSAEVMNNNLLELSNVKTAVVKKVDAAFALEKQIEPLPWDKMPIVVAGGSFNSTNRPTKVTTFDTDVIDELLANLDPNEVFFVVGHKLNGYEKYLIEHNTSFKIYAFVPALLSNGERNKIVKSQLPVRIALEGYEMGLYKSFNYEIFERRPSIMIAFDGNSAGENLIQEAKNGKGQSTIYIARRSSALRKKAAQLEGYVNLFDRTTNISKSINEILHKKSEE